MRAIHFALTSERDYVKEIGLGDYSVQFLVYTVSNKVDMPSRSSLRSTQTSRVLTDLVLESIESLLEMAPADTAHIVDYQALFRMHSGKLEGYALAKALIPK